MKLLLVVFALLGSSLATGDPCQTNCPTDYTPVCASNGMTFSNECTLQRESCLSGLALTTAQTGTCSITCPDLCTSDYQPLCANTGKTYSNYCALLLDICQLPESDRSTVAVAQLGECPIVEAPCPDMCTMDYEPVCGSNGRTFSNACILRQRACALGIQITALHDGECEQVDCPTMCTSDYQPVCGTDGVTYSNLCALDTAACLAKSSVSVASDGECPVVEEPCPGMCTMDYNPVCGSNGRTFSNACVLRQRACALGIQIIALHDGECEQVDCPTMCTSDYQPVCGTDGVTYSNLCALDTAACLAKSSVSVASDGECPVVEEPCPEMCPQEYSPVCGSDWKTYANECSLKAAACNLKVDITILAHTECKDVPCNMRCSNEAKPVCGSDGVTYTNQCLMSLASCEQRRLITSLHDGVCTLADCNMVCPEIYAPLCGTNRHTFSSLCQYDSAHCKALLATPPQSLGIAHEGICTQEITQTSELTWEIIREFDTNNDQVISFEEFKVLAALLYPDASEEEIKIFFEATDSNGDGFISADEGENIQPLNVMKPIPSSFPTTAVAVAASVLGVVLVAIVVAAVILAKKRVLRLSLKENDSLEDTAPDTPEKVSI